MDKDIVVIQNEAGDIASRAQNFQVISDATLEEASQIIAWLRGMEKRIEAKRKSYTQPLNDQVGVINEEYKGYLKPFKEADEVIQGKMRFYRQKQEEERQKEEERIRKEAEKVAKKEKISVEEVLASAPVPVLEKSLGATTFRENWEFEIFDEDRLPRQYLSKDERKIRKAVDGGVREIPGVRIYREDQIIKRRIN